MSGDRHSDHVNGIGDAVGDVRDTRADVGGRLDRPLFIIDIAVPRDVDPSVNELEGVYLYDIDSIKSVAEQSLALRRQQVAAAEAIIADHVTEFFDSISRGLNRLSQAAEHSSLAENPLRASEL